MVRQEPALPLLVIISEITVCLLVDTVPDRDERTGSSVHCNDFLI